MLYFIQILIIWIRYHILKKKNNNMQLPDLINFYNISDYFTQL